MKVGTVKDNDEAKVKVKEKGLKNILKGEGGRRGPKITGCFGAER